MNVLLAGQSQLASVQPSELATFVDTLNVLTGKAPGVINRAVGGAALFKTSASPSTPNNYWLGAENPNSCIAPCLSDQFDVVWWCQGESDLGALEADYYAGLCELHAILARSQHKRPRDLPF